MPLQFHSIVHSPLSVTQVGQVRLIKNTGFYWRITGASLVPYLTLPCSDIVVLGKVVSNRDTNRRIVRFYDTTGPGAGSYLGRVAGVVASDI